MIESFLGLVGRRELRPVRLVGIPHKAVGEFFSMEQYEVLRSHDSRRLSSPAEYVSTIGTSKHDFLSDWFLEEISNNTYDYQCIRVYK